MKKSLCANREDISEIAHECSREDISRNQYGLDVQKAWKAIRKKRWDWQGQSGKRSTVAARVTTGRSEENETGEGHREGEPLAPPAVSKARINANMRPNADRVAPVLFSSEINVTFRGGFPLLYNRDLHAKNMKMDQRHPKTLRNCPRVDMVYMKRHKFRKDRAINYNLYRNFGL